MLPPPRAHAVGGTRSVRRPCSARSFRLGVNEEVRVSASESDGVSVCEQSGFPRHEAGEDLPRSAARHGEAAEKEGNTAEERLLLFVVSR